MSALASGNAADIGTGETTLHTVTAATVDVIIGCRITNITASQILMDIFVDAAGGGTDYYLAFNVPIPAGGQYELIDENSKLVLSAGDILIAQSDTATSADAHISYLDDANN